MRQQLSISEDFYEHYLSELSYAKNIVEQVFTEEFKEKAEHFKVRIKSKDSTTEKLKRLNLAVSPESAMTNLTDIVGVRIVCRFLSDVYELASLIEDDKNFTHVKSKDYIRNPKENGYRSYHIILMLETENSEIPIEIQLRTISQDSWASLEHKMKYKKEVKNQRLIKFELKRLSDEMASSDISMQTLKDIIEDE